MPGGGCPWYGRRMRTALTLDELRRRYGTRYRWLLLATVMVGTMASIMSSTIVNVAIPDMSRYFTLGQSQAQWVSAGFMVAVTASMLLTPWLLQRFGLRRTYQGALVLLSVGAMLGGVATQFWLVIAMRVAEGLAAGVLQPIPAVIILRAFQEHERGRAMGVFGFGTVLAPAIGPSVGGVLVEHFGWRSIFFVMLPFGVAGIALARRYLPLAVQAVQRPPIDWKGLATISAATIALLNGLVQLQADRYASAALLIAGALAGIAFFVWLQRREHAPLMNLALFESAPFAVGSLVAFIYGMGLFGSTYLVPVFLQDGLAYGPAQAGLVLLPAGIALAVAMPITGRLADRYPANWLVCIGLGVLAASFALMATVGPDSAYALLLAWVLLGRVGLSLVLPALNLGAMAWLDRDLYAQGSSTINYMRQLGGAVGVSLAGIALEWRLAAHQVSLEQAGRSPQKIVAFDETFVGIAIVCLLAAGLSLRMRERRRVMHAAPGGGG